MSNRVTLGAAEDEAGCVRPRALDRMNFRPASLSGLDNLLCAFYKATIATAPAVAAKTRPGSSVGRACD